MCSFEWNMHLLIVRHAIAEERDEFAKTGKPDELRPLTPDGRRKMARAARGLVTLVPSIDLLASSPLVRAVQTAEIVAAAYDGKEIVQADALRDDAEPASTAKWLAAQKPKEFVAIVGHEPHLSLFASWMIAGADD